MKKIILLFAFISFLFAAKAEGNIVLSQTGDLHKIDLSGNLFYFIDTFSQYSFTDVLHKDFENRFIQAEEPNFFYSTNSFTQWYKVEVENNSNEFQELILGINNPQIQRLTIFSSTDSIFYNTGSIYPYDQRQFDYKNYLYSINLKPSEKGTYCIRIEAQESALYVPISLDYEDVYLEKFEVAKFFDGAFYALIFLMLFLLIILWSTEKDRSFLFFFVFSVFLLLFKLWRDEVFFDFLWPNSPVFNLLVGRALFPLLLISILLFENQYLKIVKLNSRFKRVFIATIYFGVIFTVGQYLFKSLSIYQIGIRILSVLFFCITIWALINVFRKIKREKIRYFIPFTLVAIILSLYVLLTVGFNFDIKGIGIFSDHLSKIILSTFFFVVGYVFISKFKHTRIEVVALNKNLGQLVDKRTSQLNSQKEELKSQHEELILQKETLQTQREELRAQKELLEIKNTELEKLSLVASKTNNLIFIFKPDGELDWFNSSYANKVGMTYEEYKNQKPQNIIDISSNKNIRHVLNTCLREKAVVSYESVLKLDSNDNIWYHTTLTPILDKRDEVRLLIAIDTNISKLKQFEDELNDQKQDAETQKNLAIQRKEELEERQIEITDSIRYAKRIQTAIMPKVKQIQRDFPDSFVLFLPKDIVSGDFYWYHRIGDKFFVAAVDCTGHGVPGAFMSIIGNYLLNSIIIHNGITDPAEILKHLNRKIKIALKSDNRAQTSDGMDISVAVIDKIESSLAYSGALRPMFLFSQGHFIEVKGDKIPITSSISGVSISSFKTSNYEFLEGDMFYLFSDGIIDQFGGEKGKKFLTKRFKQLLFDINPLPMKEQKEHIKKALDDWKGDTEQVDDILVMGIRF